MPVEWDGKGVVITGGSQGLGLAIALQFAGRGAKTALLARDPERLERARHTILAQQPAARVELFPCDVTSSADVQATVERLENEFGSLDVWVNNAGRSIRTAFGASDADRYRELMELNFFAVVDVTLRIRPMLESTRGHLVNIGSLASRTAWPWMSPYVASKHALAGFTEQVRLEGPRSVHVLHVCPGPLAGAEEDRYADQTDGLPQEAAQPGAGAPVGRIQPDWLAARIVRACEKRQPELIVPWRARLLFALADLAPRLHGMLLGRLTRSARSPDSTPDR